MAALTSQLMMTRETRVSLGAVHHSASDDPLPERSWRLDGDTFLMRGDGEHYLRYRRGEGIIIERGHDADTAWEPLWLAGTVHAAIACLNGLIPIHASAVAHAGGVHAFTGPSGAGKSTLIAALGQLGLPMVCDDTLVLDPAYDRVMCLPGHKRLKLTPEMAMLTGARAQEPVGPATDTDDATGKVYALQRAGDVAEALPLASLTVIADGVSSTIAPVTGGAKVRALLTDYYTVDLLAAAQPRANGQGARTLFERMSAVAAQVPMVRLTRPRDVSRLCEVAAMVADWIRGLDRQCGS